MKLKYVGPSDGSSYIPGLASQDYEDVNPEELEKRISTGWWVEIEEKEEAEAEAEAEAGEIIPELAPVPGPEVKPAPLVPEPETTQELIQASVMEAQMELEQQTPTRAEKELEPELEPESQESNEKGQPDSDQGQDQKHN